MILEEDELCEEGERLWNVVDHQNRDSYPEYLKHIFKCKKCQKGLEITEEDVKDAEKHWKSLGVL